MGLDGTPETGYDEKPQGSSGLMEMFHPCNHSQTRSAILGLLRPASLHPPPRVEIKATGFEDRISRNKPFSSQVCPVGSLLERYVVPSYARLQEACDVNTTVI